MWTIYSLAARLQVLWATPESGTISAIRRDLRYRERVACSFDQRTQRSADKAHLTIIVTSRTCRLIQADCATKYPTAASDLHQQRRVSKPGGCRSDGLVALVGRHGRRCRYSLGRKWSYDGYYRTALTDQHRRARHSLTPRYNAASTRCWTEWHDRLPYVAARIRAASPECHRQVRSIHGLAYVLPANGPKQHLANRRMSPASM